MSVEPQCGEVWLLDEASVLPGGMLALVVSGPAYNTARPRRLVVEVVTEALPAASVLLAPTPPGSFGRGHYDEARPAYRCPPLRSAIHP